MSDTTLCLGKYGKSRQMDNTRQCIQGLFTLHTSDKVQAKCPLMKILIMVS